jgi:hypothetical protein
LEPKPFYNYTQIIKETYDISESNMAAKSWVMTPFGPRWFNTEMGAQEHCLTTKRN